MIAAPAIDRLACVDLPIEEGVPLQFGSLAIDGLHTPGHTDGHFAYRTGGSRFHGRCVADRRLRPHGLSERRRRELYRSVTQKLFALSGDMLVYPAHDYAGRHVSSVAQEKTRNPRLGGGKTLEEFKQIMAGLAYRTRSSSTMRCPGNHQCGVCPGILPETFGGTALRWRTARKADRAG